MYPNDENKIKMDNGVLPLDKIVRRQGITILQILIILQHDEYNDREETMNSYETWGKKDMFTLFHQELKVPRAYCASSRKAHRVKGRQKRDFSDA